ncbi:PTS system mannose/fructose/N-acetylgalactosamine-transporter subunit IIB [Gemmatimonadota bacterium]
MSLLMVRVDDRLLHGQVTQGWGSVLNPDRFVVANDTVAGNTWEREMYESSAPERVSVSIVTLVEARERIREWTEAGEDIVLLIENPADALVLYRSGLTFDVLNMGGLHHRDGRTRILPYVCLDRNDIVALSALRDHGVTVECADVPNGERKDLFACLGSRENEI